MTSDTYIGTALVIFILALITRVVYLDMKKQRQLPFAVQIKPVQSREPALARTDGAPAPEPEIRQMVLIPSEPEQPARPAPQIAEMTEEEFRKQLCSYAHQQGVEMSYAESGMLYLTLKYQRLAEKEVE